MPASIGPGNTLPNNLIVGTTTSPTGTLTFPGITNVKPGEDFYDLTTGGAARWGDYFGGAIDPIQGGLWVSGEFAKTHSSNTARWGTWNAYFPWATSQEFNDVAPSSPYFDYINVMKLWGVTKGCSAKSKPLLPHHAGDPEYLGGLCDPLHFWRQLHCILPRRISPTSLLRIHTSRIYRN